MKKYIVGIGILVVLVAAVIVAVGRPDQAIVPTTITSKGAYLALGDSVAAGVGLKYDSDSSACDRTNQAYPDLVANKLGYDLNNIACSGATLAQGILGDQDVNSLLVTSQLQQLFTKSNPKVITITIGANDVNWTGILKKCYISECGSTEDTAAVQARLATVTTNLQAMFGQIRQRYPASPPKIIVTGYYQVFPSTVRAGCTDLTGIDSSELAWGRQFQTNINNTVRAVTKGSIATYLPIDFSGHELCTIDPWVQGLSDNQPYHPTAAGQAAIASQIISALTGIK